MELREPEAVGFLNDHDRRVRDVDAHLDHRRRHEDVELARLEARHQVPPFNRAQPPVEEADAVAAQLGTPEALRFGLGGAHLARLGLLDQRTDDVRLPARIEMLAQA